MKRLYFTYFLAVSAFFIFTTFLGTGCAQIGVPTGGKKDTIPPALVNVSPALKTVNFTDNKITLTFNEYIEVKDVQTNILVSPFPKKTPEVNYKLKTVTIKLKDTLQPNTTYNINFGNAIVDINEGNPLGNFTYVFSTGNIIDSLSVSGKVQLAESGKIDSTLSVYLYRNATDSSVQKIKPNYIAKINGKGEFTFNNLPNDNFKIYALKDSDGSKTYNAKAEIFAFLNNDISTAKQNESILLNAFIQEKEKEKTATATKSNDKKLRYTLPDRQKQDLLTPLTLQFNKPLKKALLNKLMLTDTNYNTIKDAVMLLDSSAQKITITNNWKENQYFKLIIDKDAFADSTDITLLKTDTLSISTKSQSDYGSIVLRFKNVSFAKNPVLQFVQNDIVKSAYPITSNQWSNKLFYPGEYEIRILFDENKNGIWDTGNFTKKQQPEKIIAVQQKLAIKANWDNERDIEF